MDNPGLLLILTDITALLKLAGGDGEQAAEAYRTLAGLDAMAVARPIPDFALNHRLTPCSLGGVVRGFDALDLKKGPKRFLLFQQLMAGAHRFGPRRLLASLVAQLHHPMQRGLE